MKQEYKYMWMGLAVLLFIGLLAYLPYLDIATPHDLSLNYDPDIYAGEGELCLNPYSKVNCEVGLECILISEEPHKNGVCLPEGTEITEEIITKYSTPKNESGEFVEQ